jgi:hypothetical protein
MKCLQTITMLLALAAPLALAGCMAGGAQGDDEGQSSEAATATGVESAAEALHAQPYCPPHTTWYSQFHHCLLEPVTPAPPSVCPYGGFVSGLGRAYCYASPVGRH